MKMVFESEWEREKMAGVLAEKPICPSDIGLSDSLCAGTECRDCWKAATENSEIVAEKI